MMFNEGTMAACRGALVAFALIFLLAIFRSGSVAGACVRGGMVALAVFLSIKVIHHVFFSALLNELSEFVRDRKER